MPKPSRRPRAQPARRRKDAEENPMSVPYGIGHGIFVYRSILLLERVVYSAWFNKSEFVKEYKDDRKRKNGASDAL